MREVIGGALADCLEGHLPVDASDRPLGEPHRGSEGGGQLLERRAPEEMGYERDDASQAAPARCVEGDLVDVFDEVLHEARLAIAAGPQHRDPLPTAQRSVERVLPGADHGWRELRQLVKGDMELMQLPQDRRRLESVDPRARRAPRPAATKEGDLVSSAGEAAEDLVHMDLRAAGLGVLEVLPVDEKNAH